MFFFSSRRRHTRFDCDWSSDVCSSDLAQAGIRIGGTPGDPEQDQNQRHEEYQRYHHAHEPELLSDHRKDEIGVRSEERRVGKSVDLGGRRIIKKKKEKRGGMRGEKRVT